MPWDKKMKKILQQFGYLIQDMKRWKCNSLKDIFYCIFEQGVWATIIYRVSRALFLVEVPLLKIIFRLIGFFMMKFSEIFLGVAIKPEAEIGPGLYIGHTGLIRIHPKSKIGKNLSIGPGTILGEKGLGGKGAPLLGDNVYLGTGCKVLGNVTIGSFAKIGANAVVVKDVPERAVAAGVPAKVIRIEEAGTGGNILRHQSD